MSSKPAPETHLVSVRLQAPEYEGLQEIAAQYDLTNNAGQPNISAALRMLVESWRKTKEAKEAKT